MYYINSDNVTMSGVRDVLGESGQTLTLLCSSDKINPWSKWKPISHSGVTTTLDILEANNYGFTIPYGLITNGICDTVWTYNRPSGGVSSPYRLGDFRNYNHNSRPFLNGVTVSDNIEIHAIKNIYFSLSASQVSDADSVQIRDLSDNIKSGYMTAVFHNTTKNLYRTFQSDYALGDSDVTGLEILFKTNEMGYERNDVVKMYVYVAPRKIVDKYDVPGFYGYSLKLLPEGFTTYKEYTVIDSSSTDPVTIPLTLTVSYFKYSSLDQDELLITVAFGTADGIDTTTPLTYYIQAYGLAELDENGDEIEETAPISAVLIASNQTGYVNHSYNHSANFTLDKISGRGVGFTAGVIKTGIQCVDTFECLYE